MKSQTISKTTKLSTLVNNHRQVIVFIITFGLLITLMYISWRTYHDDLSNIKNMTMNHKKEIIVSMVDHLIEQIHLVQTKLSKETIPEKCLLVSLKQRLNHITFLDGKGYIYIISYDGIVQVDSNHPEWIGKKLFQDANNNSVKLAQQIIKKAQISKGGFLNIQCQKTGFCQNVNSLLYVKGIPNLKWAVGTGISLDDLNQKLSKAKKHLQVYLISELIVTITIGALVVIGMIFISRRFSKTVHKEVKQLTTDMYMIEKLPHSFETKYQIHEFREIAKKMYQALTRGLQLQHNLQGIFDAVDQFFIILDTFGNIIGINQTVMERLSYSQKDLLNQSITFLFPGNETEKIEQIIRQMRAGIIPETFNTFLLKKDGSIIETETRFVNSQWDGKPSMLCVSKDITDLKRSKARLENIIKGTNVGTWEWNLQTNEIVYNERWANMLGYTLAELSPISIDTFIERCHPEDFERLDSHLKQHINGEISFYDEECRMKHKDGSLIWLQIRGQLISQTIDGSPLFITGTHMDITSRKQDEERLKKNLMETARINKLMEGREQRIIDLKKEVNLVLVNNNQAPKYRSVL